MECDRSGQVVWMSSETRTALGEPHYLLDIAELSSSPVARYWRVWETRDSVVVAVQPFQPERDVTGGLAAMHVRFMTHLFRLVVAERRLFVQSRPKRRGGGRKALRQMELERRRLGRELHTGAGQALAAIRIQLELIANELPAPPPQVQKALDHIGTLAADILEQVRSISKHLHPPEWQRLSLEEALRQLWLLSGVGERFDSVLNLDHLPSEPELEVKVLLYRAMQEGLSNLVRHAKATQVTVSLKVESRELILSIWDNGVGFDANRLMKGPVAAGSGIGLRSIREQAEALGATMTVESGPTGTKLVVSVASSPAEG
jgi:signal transduction histidine kinase